MKAKTLILALGVTVIAGAAHATLYMGPTTVSVPGQNGAPDLPVTYYVDLTDTSYTYYFGLTAPTGRAIDSFTVDISGPATLSDITGTSSAYIGSSVIPGQSVTWLFNQLAGSATVSFTSLYNPLELSLESSTSITGSWQDPVAPVPETSTLMAGALMILPLSVGIFRALRKERAA